MTTILLVRIALSSLAATLAAVAAERALRDVARPARFVWAGSLLLTATASVLLVAGGRLPLGVPSFVSALFTEPRVAVAYMKSEQVASSATPVEWWTVVWLALSLALAGVLAIAVLRQRARLSAARSERVSGVDVVVTRSLGPAVFGFLQPRIVVPDWLLDRPEAERRLVVEHEAEHIAARDPLLAAAALIVVCLVPWNPLLWIQLRRLRLAIELDCDARVLRRGDARLYGRLLIDVADRLARGTPLATALAFPRNFLDRRIRMIVNRRTRPLRAAALAVGAGALVIVACADPASPVASEEPQVEVLEQRIVEGERLEAEGFEPSLDESAENELVDEIRIDPTRAHVSAERLPDGQWNVEIDSFAPTPGQAPLVRYRMRDDNVPQEVVGEMYERVPGPELTPLRFEDLRPTQSRESDDAE